MNNKNYTGVSVWSEHVSETQIPSYSEPTCTDSKFIFDSTIYGKD